MKKIPQPSLSRGRTIKLFSFLILFFLISVAPAEANLLSDRDKDGVPDIDEETIYFTNPDNPDTDGDGYGDWVELNQGFSPLTAYLKLEDSDIDLDGLSDKDELRFHTNLLLADTDGDGYTDGAEIANGYNPLSPEPELLEKRIEINTGAQRLSYFLGGVKMGEFVVSTGKASMPTPKGHFAVDVKTEKAWSATYGLWMPYWMSLSNGYFGIHELPEWPNGYKEGEDHLGTPVSHGCIRLGVGDAEFLYDWTPMETQVFIY